MNKKRILIIFAIICCCLFSLTACKSCFGDKSPNDTDKDKDIEVIVPDDNPKKDETHYLKFIEDNVEILSIVVLKGDTYESLKPYFPILNEREGYVKYWDGDYQYTEYSPKKQFVVWSDTEKVIEIYSYTRKAS